METTTDTESYTTSSEYIITYTEQYGTVTNMADVEHNELHNKVFKAVLGVCISVILLIIIGFVIALIYIRRHGLHKKRRTCVVREETILMPRRTV